MGFFSWYTQDTELSIANKHSSQSPFPVYMHDDNGNVWRETDYDGYGLFGGMDYYELLANMNSFAGRKKGIDLAFNGGDTVLFPQLTQSAKLPEDVDFFKGPKTCPYQGFFY